jgi:geranylgeranyl reductase family protein
MSVPKPEADVVVVGAGPAGVSTAIHLARAGQQVHLIDRATFPRDKICGDGLTTNALRELERLGFSSAAVPSWQPVYDIRIRSIFGHEMTAPLPRGPGLYGAIAPRIQLDAALVDLARAAGVKVSEGTPLTGAQQRHDVVEIDTPAGTLRSRYAVAADGMWSPLRKALGLDPVGYLGDDHAFRQYFEQITGPAATDAFIFFEPDLLPFYVWSFPLPDNRANVGFGIERGGRHRVRDMKRLWPELLERPHVRAALGPQARPSGPHRAWPIPARIRAMPPADGRVLLVGDAIAACDPLTGEGIGQALQSGRLAAASIASGGDHPDAVRTRYRRALARHFRPDDQMSRLLMRAIRHRKGIRAGVRIAGFNEWTRRQFARWLFEDEPRGIAIAPWNWHRDFLARPGAFLEGEPAGMPQRLGSSAVPNSSLSGSV